MKKRYRLMVSDKNGDPYYNEIFDSEIQANAAFTKRLTRDPQATEIILDAVHFDDKNNWLEDKDQGLRA